MIVELTQEERDMLARLVEREIADLGPEIRHTDNCHFRDELKLQKRAYRDLLEHLHQPQST
jgi:hypothetical protein